MSIAHLENFKTFDALDNRRDVYYMLYRIGHGLPEKEQAKKRALFIKSLLAHSTNGFSARLMRMSACSLYDTYLAFIALTNAFGVPIEVAAKRLEEEVRKC